MYSWALMLIHLVSRLVLGRLVILAGKVRLWLTVVGGGGEGGDKKKGKRGKEKA